MPDRDPLIDWLFSLRGPSLKWDIETATRFDAWLGHPWRGFPSVHIAGTNGKGSVAAMLHAIGQAAELSCGLFTSPHLVRPEERIRIGAQDIDGESFRALVREVRDQAAAALARGALPRHPSFFEMMTCSAMRAFEVAPVDLAVFETGLGGRLDATNVIRPVVTVITTVSSDHTKTLGPTLEDIAREKAGIVKPGIPLLAGWIEESPLRVIEEIAHRRGAPFHAAAREISVRQTLDGSFDVVTPENRYDGLTCGLEGRHQILNAALAVRAAELLRQRGVPLPPGAVGRGLTGVRWPGRLERIGRKPEVLLDAAHNSEGARALASFLKAEDARAGRPRPRVLVFALTDGRSPEDFLGPVREHVDTIVATAPATPRAQPARELRSAIARAGGGSRVLAAETVPYALALARERAGPEGQVLVAGSLYLVGDARRSLYGLEGPGHVSRERVPPLRPEDPQTFEAGRGGPLAIP